MTRKRLNELVLERARPPRSGRLELWDTVEPGLVVRIGRDRAFAWRGRLGEERLCITLGRWPRLSVADARQKAAEIRKLVARGIDPRHRAETKKPITVAEAVDSYVERYARPRQRSWRDTENRLRHDLVRLYGNRPVAEIGRGDLVRMIDEMQARGVGPGVNRTLAHVRKLFSWLAERDLVPASPAVGLSPPAKEIVRDRVLSDDEIRAVWRACEPLAVPYGAFVKMLLLTGQRRGETAAMRWQDVDFEARTWCIPAELNKANRPHLVHLSAPALAILEDVPRLGSPVFTADAVRPIAGFSKLKARLDALSGVTGWRFHDLRRTAASGMARLGFPPHVVEKVLNHASPGGGPLVRVYQQHDYAEERRRALEAWGRKVLDIVEGSDAKVIPIRR